MINTIAFGFENVSVYREAMGGTFRWRNSRAKSITWNFFVRVIILENTTDSLNRLNILVSPRIIAVKRVILMRRSIRQSEIDSDTQVDLAASKNVL